MSVLDIRPSKKQRELLNFIDGFIKGNGYGPSYREVMRALDYKSVSTVATHIDGLITRGYLRKKDNSARSLEVVAQDVIVPVASKESAHIKWLDGAIATREALDDDKSRQEIVILKHARDILDQPQV
jgi:SOS-response transcriptional repressor LexA